MQPLSEPKLRQAAHRPNLHGQYETWHAPCQSGAEATP